MVMLTIFSLEIVAKTVQIWYLTSNKPMVIDRTNKCSQYKH